MDNDNQLKIVTRYNSTSIGAIFVCATLLVIEISTLVNHIKLSLYPFVVFMAIVFMVVTIIVLGIALSKLKVTLYEVQCPYCGNITYIETTTKFADCIVCHRPIIISDNQVKKVSGYGKDAE